MNSVSLSEWDQRFISLAQFVGQWSKDRSRRVGCVVVDSNRIVRAIGYNGFPRGIDDNIDARHARPEKYLWTEHAERNAIYQAARVGISLDGCTMYVPWFPCVDCARAILQSGISRFVGMEPDLSDPNWGGHFHIALDLLREANIEISLINPIDLRTDRNRS
jgi:dCMP deaminase